MNTRDVPDALPPNKYSAVQNIRSTGEQAIRARPGYVPLMTTGNNNNNTTFPITDIRGYATLSTDALPRFLARDANGSVWLDNNTNVGNMNGNAGFGATMLPFRPAESPQSWMYIGASGDYRKFSAPVTVGNNNNIVTNYKVGIAEPQNQVEAVPRAFGFSAFYLQGNWANSGTASTVAGSNRSTDTAGGAHGVIFADPLRATRYSMEVSNNVAYDAGQVLVVNGALTVVQEVLPPVTTTTIQSIRYDSGNNGNCTVVPNPIPYGASPAFEILRRGSIVQFGNNESALVTGVFNGPNGLLAFRCSTGNPHAANEVILGLPVVILESAATPSGNISCFQIASNITTGIGILTQGLNTNPFTQLYGSADSNMYPQQDDFVHISVYFSDPTKLVEMQVLFNVDQSGNNNLYQNALGFSIRPGDLVGIPSGNQAMLDAILESAEKQIIGNLNTPGNLTPPAQTAAGNNQWTEISVPLSSLTRYGDDESKSLTACNSVRLQVNVSNNINFAFGGLWVGGGGQLDVGNNGAPYRYQAVPLDSLTGTRGNPTPLMNYAIRPRRQSALLNTANLNSTFGGNFDTWEIYRYGGSITSYRFIGSIPTGNSNFIDNVTDAAATAGRALVFDNTEPWPSIDVPWTYTPSGSNNSIQAFGNKLLVNENNSNNTNLTIFPASIERWLPGTIFQIGANEAFTLRSRPVAANNTSYLFEFEETIGSGNQTQVFVLEPNVARQTLPYLWGPNEQGFFFGCGDPLRPGVLSFTKAYAPDAVPTAYNLDLCPPSEPLMGGEVIGGISITASSNRWWALYFQPGGSPLYQQVEIQVGYRLASPFGKCVNGGFVYFWGVDGICRTGPRGPGESLTDADLYNLFPHGGLSGINVTRNGVTYYAPDYSQAAKFRIAVRDGLLYADYVDTTGNRRTLIGEKVQSQGGEYFAWSQDVYANPVTVHYAIEQPKGTLTLAPSLYPAVVMGDNNGKAWKMQDLNNDNNNAIAAVVAPFEWNGGDLRTNELYGDLFIDVLAPAGMTVTPVSQGAAIANNTTIAANNNRQFVVASLGGGILSPFISPQINWSENYSGNRITTLYLWQPSFVDKPEIITNRFGDWDDFGGAFYVRGFKFRADTNGDNKTMLVRNSDNNNTVGFQGGPANNTINHDGEQEITYFFSPPFVSHMARYEPQDVLDWRYFAMEWIKDAWPELSAHYSPWMNMGTPEAKFIQGAVIPLDTNGQTVNIRILSSDGPEVTITANTTAGEKSPIPFSWTPFIGHEIQLIPDGPVRIWYEEIVWVYEATPELADTWITQWTGLGGSGYMHIPRIEAAWASSANVALTISSYDGTSPATITLPSTGGVMQKKLLTLTRNKGQAYRFSATSTETFQIFLNDFLVHVYDWGRPGPARPYQLVGREFGDKARI